MKKIEINLHPFKDKDKSNLVEKYLHTYFPLVGLGFIITLAVNLLLFSLTLFFNIPYRNLSKQWQELTPQVNALNSIKQELNSLKKEEKELRSLTTYKIDIAHTLFDLSCALPKNIWLANFHYEKDTLSLNGLVVKWKEDYLASIDRLIKNLKNRDYFSHTFKKIQLKDSQKDKFFGREVMKFKIVCYR